MENIEVFTVSEVSNHLKNIVESNIPYLYVEGEICNFVRHTSGHIYFSLSDEFSVIRAVFFRQNNRELDFIPQNMDRVVCFGKLTVYEKNGTYQLNIRRMAPLGVGQKQVRFEQLKRKLDSLGYFEQSRKRKIPKFPETIGVITSPTGAAIEDIRSVIERRFPTDVFLYPATVQGEFAMREIVSGIDYFNKRKNVDVILVARGGGSQEDLECFNSEQIAKAVFESDIPVISGVGHEIDFTIIDFVADLRAPTPTAAAEFATQDLSSVKKELKGVESRFESISKSHIEKMSLFVDTLSTRLQSKNPHSVLDKYSTLFSEKKKRLFSVFERAIIQKNTSLQNLGIKMEDLSLERTFRRGYAVVLQEHKNIFSVKQIDRKKSIEIVFGDGRVGAKII